MGQMERMLDTLKMPSIEESVIIEMVTNLPLLHKLDYEFQSLASRPDMTNSEFTKYVERSIGGYFHEGLRSQIDWEYVAGKWWDEREVEEEAEGRGYV